VDVSAWRTLATDTNPRKPARRRLVGSEGAGSWEAPGRSARRPASFHATAMEVRLPVRASPQEAREALT
jgi:hypothetical protein